jgi:hypothetical protein
MKIRNTTVKRRTGRAVSRHSTGAAMNLPRLFLFLEVFVEKEVPGRSAR